MNKSKVISTCKLCRKDGKELKHGHVISKFYFTNERHYGEKYWWLSDNPNKREQDGVKEYLLCFDCEQLLGSIEKEFSEKIYVLLIKNRLTKEEVNNLIKQEFATRFAICQSWRSLVYCVTTEKFNIDRDKSSIHRTEKLWREFLLTGKKFSFKLYPSFYIADVEDIRKNITLISSHINVYTESGAEFRLLNINHRLFIFSKINSLTIIGNINKTRLTKNQQFKLINDLAEEVRIAEEKMSLITKERIKKQAIQDPSYTKTRSYQAMRKDLYEAERMGEKQ